MGKTSRSGLGVGTGSSPQGSLSQGNVDAKVNELTKNLKPFDSSKFDYGESKAKYEGYLLDLSHYIGGSKAKFLKDTLGYEKADSYKLHQAIGEAIHGKVPNKVEVTTFGTKYNFNTKLKGKISGAQDYELNIQKNQLKDKISEQMELLVLVNDEVTKNKNSLAELENIFKNETFYIKNAYGMRYKSYIERLQDKLVKSQYKLDVVSFESLTIEEGE